MKLRLNEYLDDNLLDDNSFLDCAQDDLSRMSAKEITQYILEASRLKYRIDELRDHLSVVDWWLDNGEDITIANLSDTLVYLEETDNFDEE